MRSRRSRWVIARSRVPIAWRRGSSPVDGSPHVVGTVRAADEATGRPRSTPRSRTSPGKQTSPDCSGFRGLRGLLAPAGLGQSARSHGRGLHAVRGLHGVAAARDPRRLPRRRQRATAFIASRNQRTRHARSGGSTHEPACAGEPGRGRRVAGRALSPNRKELHLGAGTPIRGRLLSRSRRLHEDDSFGDRGDAVAGHQDNTSR